MSEAALRARRRNLSRARLRSATESQIIKRLIWQSYFEAGPRQSQRALARQLGVWRSYVSKIQNQTARDLEALASGHKVTLGDLAKARNVTARIKQENPGLHAPTPLPRSSDEPRAHSVDESIEEAWREVREWKRKNPPIGRRVQFSVLVR